jgi:hypothetical protein
MTKVVVNVDGVKDVCEMGTPKDLSFIPQMIHEYGESWWNYTDRV